MYMHLLVLRSNAKYRRHELEWDKNYKNDIIFVLEGLHRCENVGESQTKLIKPERLAGVYASTKYPQNEIYSL